MNFDTLEKYIQSNQLSKKIALNFLAEIEKKIEQQADKKILHKFLGLSRKTQYLQALETTENIRRWADLTFKIIRYTNFTFLDLFKQRLEEHPNKALFLEKSSSVYRKWTYKQIFAHAKEIAAFFYKKQPKSPKVLIFMQNSIESAVVLCRDNMIKTEHLPPEVTSLINQKKSNELRHLGTTRIGKNRIDSQKLKDQILSMVEDKLSHMGEIKNINMYSLVMDEVEKILISTTLNKFNGNQLKTAKFLGINRNTLRTKIEKYGLKYS